MEIVVPLSLSLFEEIGIEKGCTWGSHSTIDCSTNVSTSPLPLSSVINNHLFTVPTKHTTPLWGNNNCIPGLKKNKFFFFKSSNFKVVYPHTLEMIAISLYKSVYLSWRKWSCIDSRREAKNRGKVDNSSLFFYTTHTHKTFCSSYFKL